MSNLATTSRELGNYLEAFTEFAKRAPGHNQGWVRKLREDAFARFCEVGFPTTHDEDWRFTNVSVIAQTAFRLHSSEIAMGESATMPAREQARLVGDAWDRIPGSRARQVRLVVYCSDNRRDTFSLGVHAPELTDKDVELIHELWLDAYKTIGPQVHHRDIVSAALRELAAGLSAERRDEMLTRLKQQTGR